MRERSSFRTRYQNAIDNVARFFRDNKTLKGFGYKAKEAVIKYLEEQLAAGKSARLTLSATSLSHTYPLT